MKRKPPEPHKWRNGKPSAVLRKRKRKSKVYRRANPLRISISSQNTFVNSIRHLVDTMTSHVLHEIKTLFEKEFAKEHFATDSVAMDAASISSQTKLLVNGLKKKYDQLFGEAAGPISARMTEDINKSSHVSVRQAGEELNLHDEAAHVTIHTDKLDKRTLEILKNATNHSADFIKTIPERYLNSVADATYKSITSGNGLQDLIPFLEKQGVAITNWAHNTAMDQTRKAYNGLNVGRMRTIGVTKGEWIHSGGSQHPRELHEEFNGQTFDLDKGAPVGDDDGNDVMPGEEPNCRCTFAPVLTDEGPSEAEQDDDGE